MSCRSAAYRSRALAAFRFVPRSGFFDDVCFEHQRELQHKWISDPKLLSLIRRLLKSGLMIEGRRLNIDEGVPQGSALSRLSVLSPLLARGFPPRRRTQVQSLRR